MKLATVDTDIGPVPKWAIAARVEHTVKGAGGEWMPQALDVGSGRYLAAVFDLSAGKAGVCLYAPVWTCPERALHNAVKVAEQVAR